MTLKVRKIKNALKKKGFKERRDSDHIYYRLYRDGKRTKTWTRVSHGSGGKEIGNPLLNDMAKQLGITKSEFMDLIECPLSKEGYIEKLDEEDPYSDLTILPHG